LNKLIPLLIFSILLLVPTGTQSAFSDTMVIGPGASVTVEDGSTMIIDSDDSPNTLTNKGTLLVEDGGNVEITKEGSFFNDCNADTFLDVGSTLQIGSFGALLVTLTNHGSLLGPGQINFIADSIQVKNSDILTAVLNPAVTIMQIASICSTNGGTVIGGVFLPIDVSALLLAGAQSFSWMLPVVLSVLGIGLFVASRKSENS